MLVQQVAVAMQKHTAQRGDEQENVSPNVNPRSNARLPLVPPTPVGTEPMQAAAASVAANKAVSRQQWSALTPSKGMQTLDPACSSIFLSCALNSCSLLSRPSLQPSCHLGDLLSGVAYVLCIYSCSLQELHVNSANLSNSSLQTVVFPTSAACHICLQTPRCCCLMLFAPSSGLVASLIKRRWSAILDFAQVAVP